MDSLGEVNAAMERRSEFISRNGRETAGSLRTLRSLGTHILNALDLVDWSSYGKERWQLLRAAGYSLEEILFAMKEDGHWADGDISLDTPTLWQAYNGWTKLFYYAGATIAELEALGYSHSFNPEQLLQLQKQQAEMASRSLS